MSTKTMKSYARSAVQSAIEVGTLKKKNCEECGARKDVEAHHSDYRKPLMVTWLCVPHHNMIHRRMRGIKDFPKIKKHNMRFKKAGRPQINTEMFDKIRDSRTKNILILKSDWKLATPPGSHMLRMKVGKNFKVRTLADDSGWYLTLIV